MKRLLPPLSSPKLFNAVFWGGVLLLPFLFVIPKYFKYSNYGRTIGTVAEVKKVGILNIGGTPSFYLSFPVMEYEVEGKKYRYAHRRQELFMKFEAGQQRALLYRKSDPRFFKLDSFLGYWYTTPNIVICLFLIPIWFVGLRVVFEEFVRGRSRAKA